MNHGVPNRYTLPYQSTLEIKPAAEEYHSLSSEPQETLRSRRIRIDDYAQIRLEQAELATNQPLQKAALRAGQVLTDIGYLPQAVFGTADQNTLALVADVYSPEAAENSADLSQLSSNLSQYEMPDPGQLPTAADLAGQYAQEMMRIAEIEDMDERMDEMERFSKRHQAMLADLLLSLDNQATLLDDAFQRITQIPILINNYRELLRASQELNLIMGTVSPVEALGEVVRSWRAEFDDLTKYPNTTITIDFDTANLDPNQMEQKVIGSEAFLNATCKNLIMNAIAANSDARTMAITVTLEPVVISVGHGEDQQDFHYTEMVVRNTGRRIDLAQAEEMNTPGNKTYQRSYGTGEGRGFGLIRDGLHIASRLDAIGSTERGVMIYATPDDQPAGTEVRILLMNTSRRHRSRKLIV